MKKNLFTLLMGLTMSLSVVCTSNANEKTPEYSPKEDESVLTFDEYIQTARALFPTKSFFEIVEEEFHPAVVEAMTEIVGSLNAKNHLPNEANRWVIDYVESYFAKNISLLPVNPLQALGDYNLQDHYDFSWVPQDPDRSVLSYDEGAETFSLFGKEMHSVIFSLNKASENLIIYLQGKEENHQAILESMAAYFEAEVVGNQAHLSLDKEDLEASSCYNGSCSYTYQVKEALTEEHYRVFFANDFFNEFPEPDELVLYVTPNKAVIKGVGLSYSLEQEEQVLAKLVERFGEGNYANINDGQKEWISPNYQMRTSEDDSFTIYLDRVQDVVSALENRARADKLWQCFDSKSKEREFDDYVESLRGLSEYLCSVKMVDGVEPEYLQSFCQKKSLEHQALSKISFQEILINSLESFVTDKALDQLGDRCLEQIR